MTLSETDRLVIETRVTNEAPDHVVTYLLWFFLGIFGAHRFYLGRPGSAILQLILCLIVIGLVWWAIDLFLIPGMIREKREEVRRRLEEQAARGRL